MTYRRHQRHVSRLRRPFALPRPPLGSFLLPIFVLFDLVFCLFSHCHSTENDNNLRRYSSDDEQLVSEKTIGSNREKKGDAASGNETETSTVKPSQSQNSRKRKMSETSCDPGKQKHNSFFLPLHLVGRVLIRILKEYSYKTCYRLSCSSVILPSL